MRDEDRQVVYCTPYLGSGLGESPDNEINLLELIDILWSRKWFICGISLLATLVAVYVTLYVLPVTYQSQASLTQTGSDNNRFGALTGLASALPFSIGLPGGGQDQIMVFLESKDLQQKLIEKYNLLPLLYKDAWDPEKNGWRITDPKRKPSVVRAIQSQMIKNVFKADQDKQSSLITISWIDEDPAFAAEMLRRVITELDYYLSHEYVSDARRERIFVEKQLSDSTKGLDYWEQQVPTDEVPLSKIKRELMAATTVYAELRKQVELAKFAEEKDVVNFKVLDQPYVPVIRFKPKRSIICALTMMLSLMASILIVFIQHSLASHTTRRDENE